MKKIFPYIIGIIIIVVTIWIGKRSMEKINISKKIEKEIFTMPTFSFQKIKHGIYTNKEIQKDTGSIIINYFNPNCEHCQYMAAQYLKYSEKIKPITILMITNADSNSVVNFSKNYQLDSLPNIVLLRDENLDFYKIFGTTNVPSFFIYRNHKLVKRFIGETRIENLLNY